MSNEINAPPPDKNMECSAFCYENCIEFISTTFKQDGSYYKAN